MRRATERDAAKLALVGAASFLESFADDHPGDDVVAFVRTEQSEAYYAAQLADPACALWIAETPVATPVGYATLTPPELEQARAGDLMLKRIYSLAPWHGSGLGQALFDAVRSEAEARGSRRLLLTVYGKNTRARAFYARRGFVEIGTTQFPVGTALFEDVVMALDL